MEFKVIQAGLMVVMLFIIIWKVKQPTITLPTIKLPKIKLPRLVWGSDDVVATPVEGVVTMSESELKKHIATQLVDAFECGYVAGKQGMVYQVNRTKTIRVGYMVKGLFACDGVYSTKGYVPVRKPSAAPVPAQQQYAYANAVDDREPPPGY